MLTILLPSGVRVNFTRGTTYENPSGADTTVVFSFDAGFAIAPYTETFLSTETAAYFVTQLDKLISSGKEGVFSLSGSPAQLDALAPNPFAVLTDTINVNGAGFDPATVGFLYLNDVGTAPNFNSYKMEVTYVSPNQLTAQWVSSGGGAGILNEQVAYYKDSEGRVSNVIGGVYLSGVIALTWTSITPNTVAVGVFYSASVVGTGFLGLGIVVMKLDDGAGNFITSTAYCTNTIDDSNMDVCFSALSVASVYTLYYSTDFGASWTTTGLTVTVT